MDDHERLTLQTPGGSSLSPDILAHCALGAGAAAASGAPPGCSVRKETLLLPFTVLSSRTGLLGAVFRVSLQLQELRLEMRTHQNGPLQLHHVASSLSSPEIHTPTRGPPALSHCRAYMGHIHVQVCESKLGKEGGSVMGTFLEEGRHFPGSLIIKTHRSRFFSPFAT